ncbi:MAG: rod shape-determining protein MreD [Syntrophomonadaceae bacterium]|nr:rod shape-determining protein MreD [Syntrophomonadaceae bacterium]
MRYLMLFFLPVMALFLQSTLFGVYSIKNTLPDLLLVFVIFYALLSDARNAAKYGFFCGLLEDLLLGRFIGMNALSKGLTAYIIGVLQGSVFKENLAVGMLSVLLGTLLNYFFLFILSLMAMVTIDLHQALFATLFYQAIFNLLLATPLYVWYYNSFKYGWLRPNRER